MTRASFESPCSSKTGTQKSTSACQGTLDKSDDEEHDTRAETGRSLSTRRSRGSAIHNQSERRRRDRINQKMKTLQKLVPNSNQTDKALMLDEVIEYLKQLQAQVQLMSYRNVPQVMMPIGMQQQLQMSLLARMGMGMGMGIGMGLGVLGMSGAASPSPYSIPPLVATATPTIFMPPPFVVSMIPAHTTASVNPDSATNPSIPMHDPYCAFLSESMKRDLYNKMEALKQQQINQTTQATISQPWAKDVERN